MIPVMFRNLVVAVGYAQVAYLPLSIQLTISYSFKWTMRVISSILLFVLGVMNVVFISFRT